MYNQNRQSLAQVRTLRKKLHVAEYKDHQKSLRSLQKKYDDLSKQLFDNIVRVSAIYVRKLLKTNGKKKLKFVLTATNEN